jgi:hypothetical protein
MSSSKKMTCNGTLRHVFFRVYILEIQSCWYFRPSFVNYCPSYLLSGSTLPLPLPCVNKYTVYTNIVQCVRGYGVLGLRQTNTCRKVPSQVNFKIRHFALPSMSLTFVPYIRKTHTNFCKSDLQSNMCENTEHRKLVIYTRLTEQ